MKNVFRLILGFFYSIKRKHVKRKGRRRKEKGIKKKRENDLLKVGWCKKREEKHARSKAWENSLGKRTYKNNNRKKKRERE